MNAEPHPLDLHRFTVRRRGYDRGEVDSILRRVADSLRPGGRLFISDCYFPATPRGDPLGLCGQVSVGRPSGST